ncbi:hypothetical protein PVAP13_3NG167094 [Panicum virgatum]|uniref:Uncharacterized protein n=1 Tax=Panicum virgatum TaxID=38727 RepID=A0A8T0UC46_PANVG|nr:hypothetical protein PVAP13_3NG167094 [Panicum virgatum]
MTQRYSASTWRARGTHTHLTCESGIRRSSRRPATGRPGGVRAGGDVGAAAGTPELGLRDVGGEAGARWRREQAGRGSSSRGDRADGRRVGDGGAGWRRGWRGGQRRGRPGVGGPSGPEGRQGQRSGAEAWDVRQGRDTERGEVVRAWGEVGEVVGACAVGGRNHRSVDFF